MASQHQVAIRTHTATRKKSFAKALNVPQVNFIIHSLSGNSFTQTVI